MTTNEKLSMLREKMAEAGVQAYLIPSSDPHISEYLPDHWRARAWLSGFDGSAGTLVVTETESGLWTDGRYFIQAERQMAGSEIVLYRMKEKGVPTIQEFLLSRLKKGQVLGIDGMVTAAEMVLDMETAFSAQGIGNIQAFLRQKRSLRSAPGLRGTGQMPWQLPAWTALPGF